MVANDGAARGGCYTRTTEHKTNQLLVMLSIAIGCITAWAGDDRFGFATHFEQGWPTNPDMQDIAAAGVSYIRDDLNSGNWEPSLGVYVLPASDMAWLTAAQANGLKVVAVLGPNSLYADKYDPTAMSNLATWIAKTGLVTAFEITNEPNNAYAAYEGSTWESKLVTLTNAVTAAVHAVNPSIQVIGLGAQGTQIFDMLAMGTTMNGVVYHPYGNGGGFIPESTYEWEWRVYAPWIQAIDAETSLPKWETEWGIGTNSTFTTQDQADFVARRLLEEAGLGVEHSFIYEFQDNGTELYGVDSSNPTMPKVAYYVAQRIISTLNGAYGGTSAVTINSVVNGDVTDVYAFAYQGAKKTVISFWFGNYDPRTPPPSSKCRLTFTVPNAFTQAHVMNAVTGNLVPLSTHNWSQNGTQVSVGGLTISDAPRMIIFQ
ncbi:MAG: hypothetical protein JOZ31_04085 [Verrucomicrobia bacterium]|nr:hypothetical protein [Verrucomicrobiota bacterium]